MERKVERCEECGTYIGMPKDVDVIGCPACQMFHKFKYDSILGLTRKYHREKMIDSGLWVA